MEEKNIQTEKLETPNPEIQQVPPSNIYPLPKNKKGAKILAIIFLIFVLVGILFASIGFFYKDKLANLIVNTTSAPVSVSSTAKPDPTANWQTYQKEKYGYEYKIPLTNYELLGSSEYNDPIEEETIFTSGVCIPKCATSSGSFSVFVYQNQNKWSLDEWLNKSFYGPLNPSVITKNSKCINIDDPRFKDQYKEFMGIKAFHQESVLDEKSVSLKDKLCKKYFPSPAGVIL